MKVYNCFEDLKETFTPSYDFICEGELFELKRMERYDKNNDYLNGVNLINIKHGIMIRVFTDDFIYEYIYYSV